MNKTNIDWTDFTWNPITGCLGPKGDGIRCPYCYAHRLAWTRLHQHYTDHRFPLAGNVFDPFAPRFWRDRLEEPLERKKPAKIFVADMGDLFGEWVPEVTLNLIFDVIRRCPQHTFQVLTKWPQRLHERNPWPPNVCVGATATDEEMAHKAISFLNLVDAPVRFLSLEPLLGPMENLCLDRIDWVIIGGQTGPGARDANLFSVHKIAKEAHQAGVPVFLKDNLKMPVELKEWPRNTINGHIFPTLENQQAVKHGSSTSEART